MFPIMGIPEFAETAHPVRRLMVQAYFRFITNRENNADSFGYMLSIMGIPEFAETAHPVRRLVGKAHLRFVTHPCE